MSITGGAVLFIVIWFMTLFITLQVTTRSQAEDGEVVPGTHAGAPADFRVKRTLIIVTLITIPVFAVIAGIILSGVISVEDIDLLGTK